MYLPDECPDITAGLWVKTSGGFVQDYQFRVVDQAGGHGESLHLAAREMFDVAAGLVKETYLFQQGLSRYAFGIKSPEEREDLLEGKVVEVG